MGIRDAALKTEAIERFDALVCTLMIEWLEARGEAYQVVLTMDHRTPVALKGTVRTRAYGSSACPTGRNEESLDETCNEGVSDVGPHTGAGNIRVLRKDNERMDATLKDPNGSNRF